MARRARVWLWLIIAASLALFAGGAGAQSSDTVPSIEFSSTVDPASAQWIGSALDDAANDDAPLAIIRLDTPGGLDDSMREIVKDILGAPMPVVVYVSPDGARAASAGAFITEAADVAAMAPQTNIGSASAVTSTGGDIGGTLGRKIENDASAFIRALATSHGRDGALPERMVTDAANVTADEALRAGAIDVVAANQTELLTKLDGFQVRGPKAQTLHTAGLQISERDTPLQYQLLGILVNPNIAYLLLLVGIVGIAIELFSPGLFIPGTLGVIALLLGAYGTAQLPVTAVGIALLVAGLVMLIAEAHLPTHGILGAIGVIALALSGLLLFNTHSTAVEVSPPLVIVIALLLGGGLAFAVRKVVEARRRPVKTGHEELVGATGEVRATLYPVGQVFVDGALWRARFADDVPEADTERGRERGARVRVEAVEGLTLRVRPLSEAEPEEGAR